MTGHDWGPPETEAPATTGNRAGAEVLQGHSKDSAGLDKRTGTDTRTANLHGLTVAQAAKAMNVSERMVFDAIKLRRSGRADLVQRVQAGELTIHRALIEAGLKRKPTSSRLDALCHAWNRCNRAERLAFIERLKGGA